jgi:integrase
MSIENLAPGKWLVRVRSRINGAVAYRQKVVTGEKIEAKKIEHAFFLELANVRKNSSFSSLKILHTFGDVLTFWTERTTAKLDSIRCLIDRMKNELGRIRHEEIKERFGDFLDALRTEKAEKTGRIVSPATRNRYLVYGKIAYSFAVKRGKLKENPLKEFDRETEFARDRVWTPEERKRIFETLEKRKSHLYWPVYFASMNPIRKGDLIALTRENFNPFKPEIHFIPQKTGKRIQRETNLVCLDERMLSYLKSLPADCPLLFPRFDEKGKWHSLGDFKNEWKAVLKDAKVSGMVPHDLKHCAITWMLDNGFRELDLRNLGIQYTPAMVRRYYHEDADKALETWKRIKEERLKSGRPQGKATTMGKMG